VIGLLELSVKKTKDLRKQNRYNHSG